MAGIARRPNEQNFSLLVIYLLSLIISVSDAADTLYANQSLSGDQTIVSLGENFELGFFSPGNSSNYYIGMWFKKVTLPTPQIVWVANRETPVLDKYSTELRIVGDNLMLLNESTIFWSTNVSSNNSRISLVAVLLENGNFVLRDGSNSDMSIIWQSFDHPTNTWLPDMKFGYNNRTGAKQVLTSWRTSEDPSPGLFSLELDPVQKQYLLMWNRSEQYWTSGSWDGQKFSFIPQTRSNFLYSFRYISNENESFTTYSLNNPSVISRYILDVTGQAKQLTWLENTHQWNLLWAEPNECDVYSLCGEFGACNVQNGLPICNCLTGFRPKSAIDWSLGGYSDGCVRRTGLQCGNTSEAGFFMNSLLRLPTASQQMPVQTAVECESLCSNNCSCVAYAYDFKYSVCHIWTDELLNIKLSGVGLTDRLPYIKLVSSDLPSVKGNAKFPRDKLGIIIASVIFVVILSCSIGYIFYRKVTRRRDMMDVEKLRADVPFFDFKNILAATDDFSDSNMLGKGGFGPVYKGKLSDGQEVAVKRLSSHSGQGLEEFKNEVVLIAKLQHRNLVKILGYCTKGDEKIILYEFMLNKSLDTFIFDQTLGKLLDWPKRYEIILGITRGLLYLHQDSRLRIIHRDLKTSNILLDEEMNPKISDFGLARIVGGRETDANTQRVVGTYGYMSPEYAFHGHFSIKSDVFSYGVLMLEIVSGKRNSKFYDSAKALSLSDYAWNLWKEEKPLELMDQTLVETLNFSEALKCILIGLLCVQEDPSDRPTMNDVALMLVGDIAKIPDPKKPAFVARERLPRSSSSKSTTHSRNGLTVSLQDGR